MKKIALSLALITAGFFAFNASAQEPCCNPEQACCETEGNACCQTKKAPCVFDGLNLTADQQASVKALNEKYAQNRKEGMKAKKEARAQENKGRQEAKQSYLKEMQGILTPEQYVVYLENIVVSQPAPGQNVGRAARPMKHDGKKDGKKEGKKDGKRDAKKGKKGTKGQNGQTPEACCE